MKFLGEASGVHKDEYHNQLTAVAHFTQTNVNSCHAPQKYVCTPLRAQNEQLALRFNVFLFVGCRHCVCYIISVFFTHLCAARLLYCAL